MSTIALIGLGSNLGNRKSILDAAIAALRVTAGISVRAASAYHETQPVGGPIGQGLFLNAAVSLDTTLDPLDLLRALQAIESQAGRVRVQPWGERTLDLDLLLYGDQVIDTGPVFNRVFGGQTVRLLVPHPWLALRRFVLAPLAEIAPEVVHPVTQSTIGTLLANLDRRPSYVEFLGSWSKPLLSHVFERLLEALGAVGVSDAPQGSAQRPGKTVHRSPDPEAVLKRRTDALLKERWSHLAERWLVSDFALPETPDDSAISLADDSELATRLTKHLREQAQFLVVPTFSVELARKPRALPSKATPSGAAAGVGTTTRFSRHPSGIVPSLIFDTGDSDQIVQTIRAACAATRTG